MRRFDLYGTLIEKNGDLSEVELHNRYMDFVKRFLTRYVRKYKKELKIVVVDDSDMNLTSRYLRSLYVCIAEEALIHTRHDIHKEIVIAINL